MFSYKNQPSNNSKGEDLTRGLQNLVDNNAKEFALAIEIVEKSKKIFENLKRIPELLNSSYPEVEFNGYTIRLEYHNTLVVTSFSDNFTIRFSITSHTVGGTYMYDGKLYNTVIFVNYNGCEVDAIKLFKESPQCVYAILELHEHMKELLIQLTSSKLNLEIITVQKYVDDIHMFMDFVEQMSNS